MLTHPPRGVFNKQMAKDPVRPHSPAQLSGQSTSRLSGLSAANDLFSAGHVRQLAQLNRESLQSLGDEESRVRFLITVGMAHYELGHVVESIDVLRQAYDTAQSRGLDLQFQAALALFSRESQ